MKKYARENPFPSFLLKRELAVSEGSSRKTFHIVLDTTELDQPYKVGDSVGILPTNDEAEVAAILDQMNAQDDLEFSEYLRKKANLMRVNRALVSIGIENGDLSKDLLESENKEEMTNILQTYTLRDLLSKVPLTKQQVIRHAMPMLPRFYSIASSQKVLPNELHLLVAHVQFEVNGKTRTGIGSDFLGVRAEIETTPIPFYIQPSNHFTLPEDPATPIIMIGPGTGVAPFRAFMQERVANSIKGKNWLFFGERNSKTDFYYESFWKDLVNQGDLILDTAFSRDTSQKIYVQSKLLENKQALWEWIQEGAYIYVCGDAKEMAREVEIAICKTIKEEGNFLEEAALQYFRKMRRERRYLADVY